MTVAHLPAIKIYLTDIKCSKNVGGALKEITGNLWDYYSKGFVVAITTNGFVKTTGECVMGRGCALEAKMKFPGIDKRLGLMIKSKGNNVHYLESNIVSFPVKHNWWENADIQLIEKSAKQIATLASLMNWNSVIIPRPGCGNGKLKWSNVKPILEKHLDDRFMIISF
jgi:hypothetical protein